MLAFNVLNKIFSEPLYTPKTALLPSSLKNGLAAYQSKTDWETYKNEYFSIENGIFVKTRSNLGYIQAGGYKRHKLTIRRIINGFSTNEIITFTNSGEVVYEGERFTQEDLERLPALEELFDFLQAQTLLPENAEEYLKNGF